MKRFSQEFISREIYYNSLYSMNHHGCMNQHYCKNMINSHYRQLIGSSQPFEVIDGDTLDFVSEVYKVLFADADDKMKTLVVSVVGP